MTARRRFFSKILALAAGALGVAACGKEAETTASSKSSTEPDRKLLDAFVDTVIPKDQDPGAVEAGVTDELLTMFEKKQEMKQMTIYMLTAIDVTAYKKFSTSFKKLELDQREKVLQLILHSRDKKDHPARKTIHQLRGRIVRFFYLSPTAREMLAYTAPYPMGYPDYNSPPPE